MGLPIRLRPNESPRFWLSFEHHKEGPERKTLALLNRDDGLEIAVGVARVHPEDQYVKEIGRQVALADLFYNLYLLGVPIEVLTKINNAYWNRLSAPSPHSSQADGTP